MIDQGLVLRCRARLIDVAKKRSRIPYSDLAKYLRVANQSVGLYLNAIYKDEIAVGRPDLTLVAVYADTGYGRYNSRGRQPQSIEVDPKNPSDVRAYAAELNKVYAEWWT